MADKVGRVNIRLRPDEVGKALGLDPTLRVVGVHTTFDPPALIVMVEGAALPVQPPDSESPRWRLEPTVVDIQSSGRDITVGVRPARIVPWEVPF